VIATASRVQPPGVGRILRLAVRDFYEESWRLVALNAALSVYVLSVLAVATLVPAALVLLLGAGAIGAALVSAAVTIVETGSLTFMEMAGTLRRCWLRGLVLSGSAAAGVAATVFAFRFYGDAGTFTWPLAVLVLYFGAIFLLYQLLLWPLAVRDCENSLRGAASEAGLVLIRRPAAVTGLGLALLAVNVAGVLLAVLPLLTMTIAYSALAAARFVLPPPSLEEDEPWRV
jgi:hypothetical protein